MPPTPATKNFITDTVSKSLRDRGLGAGQRTVATPQAVAQPPPPVVPPPNPPVAPAAPESAPEAPPPSAPPPTTSAVAQGDALSAGALLDQALGIPPSATVEPLAPSDGSASPEDVPPEVQTNPQAAHAWAKKSAALKAAERRAQDEAASRLRLEEQLKETEQKTKAYEEQAKSLQETVGKLSLESDPSFQAKYDGEVERLRSRLRDSFKEYVRASDEDAEKWSRALLTVNHEECTDLMDQMKIPAFLQGVVVNTRLDVNKLLVSRSSELSDWRNSQTAYRELQAREFTAQQMASREKLVGSALDKLRTSGNWMLDPGSSPEQAEVASKRRTAISSVIKSASDAQLVELAADGLTAPAYRALASSLASRVQELQAQLKGITGGSPQIRPAPLAPAAPVAPDKGKPMTPNDYVRQAIPNLRADMIGRR